MSRATGLRRPRRSLAPAAYTCSGESVAFWSILNPDTTVDSHLTSALEG